MNARSLLRSLSFHAWSLSIWLLIAGCATGGGGGGGGGGDGGDDGTTTPDEGMGDGEDDETTGPDDEGPAGAAAAAQDLWTTDTETTSSQDFSASPVPAGFFDFNGMTCDAFAGAASFVGNSLSENTTGAADTIVDRNGDPIAPSDPVGAEGSVEVRITNLQLVATEPIIVMCSGQPTEWSIRATLSDTPSPAGTLTAMKTHENGGTAEATLPVLLKLTFTNTADASVQRVLDFAEEGLNPVEFQSEMTWVHRIDPDDTETEAGFIVGVAGGPEAAKLIDEGKAGRRLQGGQTLIACTEHSSFGRGHLHNTCTADTDGDGIPDGTDNCRFLANPSQEDRDKDTFGDACDPCPDDPECPQGEGECESTCREINEELIALSQEFADELCDLISECSRDALSAECQDLLDRFQTALPEFICIYTRYTGYGCDQFALDPIPPPSCPDPCETTTCPEGETCQSYFGCVEAFDYCEFVTCPEGEGCDPETGQCCEDPESGCAVDPCGFVTCPEGQGCDPETGQCCEDPESGCPFDFCAAITCPEGNECNPATGQCWNRETGECQQFGFELCAAVTCEEGQACDPASGACVPADGQGDEGLCTGVTCADDQFCDPSTGQCMGLGNVDICEFIPPCPEGQTCNPNTGMCE